jgi:hypothetical protein
MPDPIDDVIAEAERTRRPNSRLLLTIAVTTLVIAFVAAGVYVNQRRPPADVQSRFRIAAEGIIRKSLKSPATASFAAADEWRFEQIDSNTWRMRAWVDSENEFGAYLRDRFTVIVSQGDAGWRLRFLKTDGSEAVGEYMFTPTETKAEVTRQRDAAEFADRLERTDKKVAAEKLKNSSPSAA